MTGDAGSSLSRRKPRMDGAGIMKAKTADAKKIKKISIAHSDTAGIWNGSSHIVADTEKFVLLI